MFETVTLPRFHPQQVLKNSTVAFSGIPMLAEYSEAPRHTRHLWLVQSTPSHWPGFVASLCVSLGLTNWVSVGPKEATPPCPQPFAKRMHTVSLAPCGTELLMSSCFLWACASALSCSWASSSSEATSSRLPAARLETVTLDCWSTAEASAVLSRGLERLLPAVGAVCIHETSSW